MINRNVMGRTPDDSEFGADLAYPPEAELPVDPQANSTAMLGSPDEETGEVSPEEAGPGASLAFLGMMVQGAQGLSSRHPGFIPMEITAWLQQAMQILPQMLQHMQSGLGAGMPGAGMQSPMGQTMALGPSAPPPTAAPSGPPARSY